MNCLHPYVQKDCMGDAAAFPCGKCMPCRIRRTTEWTMRLTMELQEHEDAYFVTLTYEGEEHDFGSLEKTDAQSFVKRLRKTQKTPLKYFLSGEYGARATRRPHYHVILFGWKPPPGDFVRIGGTKKRYSKTLQKVWPKGNNTVGTVNNATMTYVAGYCRKKLYGAAAEEEYGDRTPPFQLQSQGIGKRYIDGHKEEMLETLGVYFKGKRHPLPRYFRKKLWGWFDTELLRLRVNDNSERHKLTPLETYEEQYNRSRKELQKKEALRKTKEAFYNKKETL